MPLTSVSGMHVTGRLKLSDPPSEGTPRRVTQLSQYGGNLTIVLEVQFHGFHALFTRVHGHPPFWSRILSAHPFGAFRSGLDTHFQRRRRAEPCSYRNVSRQHRLKPAHGEARIPQRPDDACHVAAPAAGGRRRRIVARPGTPGRRLWISGGGCGDVRQGKGGFLVDLQRVNPHQVVAAPPARQQNIPADGQRHDEAVVVIGMLADEVDPPRRPDQHHVVRRVHGRVVWIAGLEGSEQVFPSASPGAHRAPSSWRRCPAARSGPAGSFPAGAAPVSGPSSGTARSRRAMSSAAMSTTNVPAPVSLPAKYFSLSGARCSGQNSTWK